MPARVNPFDGLPVPFGMTHRGGGREACENSPAAFDRTVALGFTVVETDVRATIDGHVVVFHDATLDRTTDAAGPISAQPLRRVQRASLANGEHPVTLAEALRRWPTLRFNIDVKSPDAIGPFLRTVAEADAWHRVCAASFSTSRLQRLRALGGPRLATSLGSGEVTRLVLGAPTPAGPVAAQVPARQGRVPVVTPGFVARAHARGLQVHVWTINEATEMGQLLGLGVDALVTDRPSLLAEVLARRSAWR